MDSMDFHFNLLQTREWIFHSKTKNISPLALQGESTYGASSYGKVIPPLIGGNVCEADKRGRLRSKGVCILYADGGVQYNLRRWGLTDKFYIPCIKKLAFPLAMYSTLV